jgi:hypothetical protein
MSKMEIIEVFGSRADAELAKGYLESMGIESRIIADDADQLYPSLGVVRGIKLVTKSNIVKRAKKLLDKKRNND